MPTLVATDLDRTMIYSGGGLGLTMPDEEAPTLVAVEVLDSRPHSFLTETAADTLRRLHAQAAVVPITTRTVAQYRRVRFPGVRPTVAITSNGGQIVRDGVPDEKWHHDMHAAINAGPAGLDEVVAELKHRAHDPWALKRRTGDGLFCYLVADLESMPDDFLPGWRAWCAERDWAVSQQGRKIYAIPRPLSKEGALLRIADELGATRILAAGDGALDSGFLAAADAGIRPPHGELAALSWHHPTVTVAARSGVLAADDITAWFEASL